MEPERVTVCAGPTFGCVAMREFLTALPAALTPNASAFTNFSRMYVPPALPPPQQPDEPLRVNVLFKQVQQRLLGGDSCVIAEVGDSWFNTQRLRLPAGAEYQMQLRYDDGM